MLLADCIQLQVLLGRVSVVGTVYATPGRRGLSSAFGLDQVVVEGDWPNGDS